MRGRRGELRLWFPPQGRLEGRSPLQVPLTPFCKCSYSSQGLPGTARSATANSLLEALPPLCISPGSSPLPPPPVKRWACHPLLTARGQSLAQGYLAGPPHVGQVFKVHGLALRFVYILHSTQSCFNIKIVGWLVLPPCVLCGAGPARSPAWRRPPGRPAGLMLGRPGKRGATRLGEEHGCCGV